MEVILQSQGALRLHVPAPGQPVVTVVAAETTLTFTIATATGLSAQIWYRVHGATTWSKSTILETPIIGETIQLTGLDADEQYNAVAFSFAGAGGRGRRSEPGTIMTVSTLGASSDLSASGIISEPLENFRTLVTNSSNFQTWVSHDNAADAKHHAFILDVPDVNTPGFDAAGLNAWEPYCLIMYDEWSRPAHATGVAQVYGTTGAIKCRFFNRISASSPDYTPDTQAENAVWDWANDLSGIIDDILDLAGQSGFLMVTGGNISDGPFRSTKGEKQTQGEYFDAEFTFPFGLTG